ncbi:MAG: hypothetical protein IJY15_12250, partial [Thermoguttaceae bacterium]|nr:hypothetical protein [Thermoguttaceae bacterium]
MTLLTENVFFWGVCVAFAAIFSFVLGKATNRKSLLFLGLTATLTTAFLGAICLFYLETDRKAVRRTVLALGEAVGQDDVDATLSLVSPTALKTRLKARAHMALAEIE